MPNRKYLTLGKRIVKYSCAYFVINDWCIYLIQGSKADFFKFRPRREDDERLRPAHTREYIGKFNFESVG